MAGERLPAGIRDAIIEFARQNPNVRPRAIARHFGRGEELVRQILIQEGLTQKGKIGPRRGSRITPVFAADDHGYIKCEDERKAIEQQMRFEDEPDIPASDSRRMAWR